MKCVQAAVLQGVFEPVANFTHSVIRVVGRLVPTGSRVGFLLFFTVISD
jgi:hypothetical protein